MKLSRTGLILVLAAALCAPAAGARPRKAIVSGNYSGYERTGDVFTAVAASWQVPLIDFGTQKHVVSMSAEWIGIGGVVSTSIIQVGTVHQLDAGGFRSYEAYYELYPASLVVIAAGRVLPGDVINASVRCTSHCTPSQSGQTWTVAIEDATQNWRWSQDFAFVSDLSSAEIIEEKTTLTGRRFYALPNFGTVTFKDITINGLPADLNPTERVQMRTGGGGTANPSEPNASRDGFNICWGDGREITNCTAKASDTLGAADN